MGIAEADVARVRAATDLAALIGERTALKRVGRRLVGLCPFHSERSPSFSVNAEEGLYYCFGCHASGDAISFVRATEGCSFVEAVERLAGRAGLSIEISDDPALRAERQQRRRLAEVLTAAVDFYHVFLLENPEARPAREYLRRRGLHGETARRFRLGYAPAGPDALVRALRAKGASAELLAEAGLAWTGERGRRGDVFRERVIFPIFDPGGQAIALGGRILPDELRTPGPGGRLVDAGPKYRNSAESPLYSKRRTLYGLNWAKGEIARTGEVVVCEGYTDVIGCFRAGVERAVATCGTSLTEDHVRVLANFAKRVVLAFDADAAGQNAAARLYEWERRHDVELAVAALPAVSDPGDLAQSDPPALAAAVAEARPFLAFVVDRALRSHDLTSPEGRARAAAAALAAVAEHPNDLVRDQYVERVADLTRIDAARLRAELASLRAHGTAGGRPAGGRPGGGQPDGVRQGGGRSDARRPSGAGRGAAEGDGGGAHRDDGWRASGGGDATGHGARGDDGGFARTAGDDAPPWLPDDERGARSVPGSGGGLRSGGPAGRDTDRARPGRHVLLVALHRPGELAPLLDAGICSPLLFADERQRRVFDALAGAEQLHDAIAAAEPDVASMLRELAVSELPETTSAEDAVLALARTAAEQALSRAGAEARLAERAEDPERYARASADSRMLRELVGPLRDPLEAGEATARQAASALVAWLTRKALEG